MIYSVSVRPVRIEGNIAYVPLTKGYEAVIDAADAALVGQWNWHAMEDGGRVYAARKDHSAGRSETVRLHRLLTGAAKGVMVDHRDGDGLNNRRKNLRTATNSQNQHNRRPQQGRCSLKGVSWHCQARRWRAHISVDGRKRHLGLFDTPEAAHAAYCKASTELHGEFGRVN